MTIEEDNCCGCNAIAIRRHFLDENMTAVDIVYTSCHDAVRGWWAFVLCRLRAQAGLGAGAGSAEPSSQAVGALGFAGTASSGLQAFPRGQAEVGPSFSPPPGLHPLCGRKRTPALHPVLGLPCPSRLGRERGKKW